MAFEEEYHENLRLTLEDKIYILERTMIWMLKLTMKLIQDH